MPTCGQLLPCWSSLVLDGESQFPEHRRGAALPALEIAGGKVLARGELISCAQDRFVWVTAFVPDQLITPARTETMLREEPFRPELVVFLYRAQHLITGHVCPQPGQRIGHRVLHDLHRRGVPGARGGWGRRRGVPGLLVAPGHDAAADVPDGAGGPAGCRFLPGTRTAAGRPCATAAGVASAHRGGAGANADGSGVATWLESTSTMSSRMGRSRLRSSSCSAFPTLKSSSTATRASMKASTSPCVPPMLVCACVMLSPV